MKALKVPSIVLLFSALALSCGTKPGNQDSTAHQPRISFVDKSGEKRIDVMVDGKLFTSYRWPEEVSKPILYPVFSGAGTEITRGYPLHPRVGERADHAHHIGMWLTYGDVNGLDFWGNGSQGLGTLNENGGIIRHLKVHQLSGGPGEGSMSA